VNRATRPLTVAVISLLPAVAERTCVWARPCALVLVSGERRVAGPLATAQATVAPGTAFPASSVTAMIIGCACVVFATMVWPLPDTIVTFAGVPTTAFIVNDTDGPPAIEAVTVSVAICEPTV
jgi:membrane-associated PAP2 superfamily phosphatase